MVKNNQLGQSILEAIFAIAITGMILAGFVSAIIFFGRTSQVAQSGTEATQLAQEKIEQLRADRKRSPFQFWQDMDNYVTSSPITENLENEKYTRISNYIDQTQENENRRVKVEVKIEWQDQDQTKETIVTTYFSQY